MSCNLQGKDVPSLSPRFFLIIVFQLVITFFKQGCDSGYWLYLKLRIRQQISGCKQLVTQ